MPVSHRRAPRVARDTTVYTNAPNRRGEARSSHLCTLLRSQGHSQPKPIAQQCTQTPKNGVERPDPPICVHYLAPRGRPRHNSVHKRPNLAPGGSYHPFVYTIVIPRPFTTQAHSPTVYTNAQNWRREPRSSHSCTLLRSHGATRDATVYINAPNRCPEALTAHLCTLLRSLAPQESRQISWSNMSSSSRTWSSSRRRARW